MDIIEFMTENNEFKIQMTKVKKLYSISKFTQYECSIRFINTLGNTVLELKCSEKEFLIAMNSLNMFFINIGSVYSDNIYFTSYYQNPCFMYISSLNVSDHPVEEERLQISIYESSIYGNILRMYLEMNYEYLEKIVYNMYLILQDIPYLNEMNTNTLLEFMEED